MSDLTYRQQLLDPRWQRKRLECMQAAEFRCARCMDSGATLHVHHKRYVKGRFAWEYDNDELAVLCESCHKVEHEESDIRKELIARLELHGGPLSIDRLISVGAGANMDLGSMYGDECSDRLRELLLWAHEINPRQSFAGRIAQVLLIDSRLSKDGMGVLAARLESAASNGGDFAGFFKDFEDLLTKYGVIPGGSIEEGRDA